jgi:hypothetical protein
MSSVIIYGGARANSLHPSEGKVQVSREREKGNSKINRHPPCLLFRIHRNEIYNLSYGVFLGLPYIFSVFVFFIDGLCGIFFSQSSLFLAMASTLEHKLDGSFKYIIKSSNKKDGTNIVTELPNSQSDVEEGQNIDKEGGLDEEEIYAPRADGGKDAWLFLAGCFIFEALIWGE